MTLRTRVQKLEAATDLDDTGHDVFVVFVSPGSERKVRRIRTQDQVWQRRDGETEEQLRERAKSEALPPAPNCARLFLCDSDSHESSSTGAFSMRQTERLSRFE
jgi:hypothetical protein